MNRLWRYQDFVKHLSHENTLVRRWAFHAVENRYQNRYTDEVSRLINDKDEYLASAAPLYLAEHCAVRHAPAILECFKKTGGNVSSNCASALGRMKYEPALEEIVNSISNSINSESLYGVFEYLGSIQNENSRETLLSVAMQVQDPLMRSRAFANLLQHNHPEAVKEILLDILESVKQNQSVDGHQIKGMVDFWDADVYFNSLTMSAWDANIVNEPKSVLHEFLMINPHIPLENHKVDVLIKILEKVQYHDLVTILMFEVKKMLKHRYPDNNYYEESREFFVKDTMAVILLKELSRQPSVWKKLKKEKTSQVDILISFVLSVYFSVLERGLHLPALFQEAGLKDLFMSVKKAGPGLPEVICRKIAELAPVYALKNALSEKPDTWGDTWIVRIMGRIGSREFLPDLLRVLYYSDGLSYIYESSLRSIITMDESADESKIRVLQNHSVDEPDSFYMMEHLSFAEIFDLALQKWEGVDKWVYSYGNFASCLMGIGDKRGIEKLQEIYVQEDDADGFIGDALECLSTVHGVVIPQLDEIHKKREEKTEKRETPISWSDEIYDDMEKTDHMKNIIPFKTDSPEADGNKP